jgi:hypothetical protein
LIFDLLALSYALVIFCLLTIYPFRCFLGQAQQFVPAARIGIFESSSPARELDRTGKMACSSSRFLTR